MGKLQCYTRWNNLSEMVKNLMTEAVEYHFGIYTTPQDRVAFGQWLCLYVPCNLLVCHSRRDYPVHHTPYHSPESNGMAESFVKTFKGEYVSTHILPDARTVMELLSSWFEDYNEYHPHKGLKMKSPREYRRQALR